MTFSRSTYLFALALAATGSGCLDALGAEEDVTEHGNLQGMGQLQDDRIEDKHPTFDASRTTVESFTSDWSTCNVTLNKSATVTRLSIAPLASGVDGRLFHGRTEALAALPDGDAIPSMEVVNGTLKPFNDGLYAAVELQVENDKQALLRGLLASVVSLGATADASTSPAFLDAEELLGTALTLGGTPPAPPLDQAAQARVRARVATFSALPVYARPIGFYTWTTALSAVFTRDRFLQELDGLDSPGAFVAIALALARDPALLASYQHVTALYAGLTNPYDSYAADALIPYLPAAVVAAGPTAALHLDADGVAGAFAAANPSLNTCGAPLLALLPFSRNKENDYFDSMFCQTGVPAGTDLLDVLVHGIQSGAVDLTPAADAGWYDYQSWALETLLLPERGPESQHLLLTAGYKKKLIDTFKTILIQNRETHVKQLNGGSASLAEPQPVDVYPLFPVEPSPTFYLRSARGYRFLRTFLQSILGTSFLADNARLLETGQRASATLATELDARISLLYGLFFLSADAVGMAYAEGLMPDEMTEIDATSAVSAARKWLMTWRADADVVRDPRVIVPLFNSQGFVTYEAVVGVKALGLQAEFVAGHEPQITPTECWTGKLVPHTYALLTEETAQARLPEGHAPPTRDELRAICDAHATKADIVHAIESL